MARMLDRAELAAELHCSSRSIDRRVLEGMPHTKVGRLVRFDLEMVNDWLAAQQARSKSKSRNHGGRPRKPLWEGEVQ